MNQPITPGLDLPARATVPPAFLDALTARFGARASTNESVRLHHGRDESSYLPMPPDVVVFAESTDDVVAVMQLCRQYRVPLIPFGGGTSLEGALLSLTGGVSLDMTGMNRIVRIDANDLTATVQPGVTRKQLNAHISDTGLFFPIDPGADATLGGMCSTRASGTNAVRYGTMRENVVALTVVTAEAKVVRTARRAKKSAAGYDLTRLFVGSEGTLGVITEVTVRLYPQPEAISAAICNFESVDAAVESTIEIIQSGIPVARVELMDTMGVKAVNAYSKLTLKESPLLLFEFHGSPTGVREQAELVQEITASHGGTAFEWAERPEDRTRLWTARHNAYFATLQLRPGARSVTTDVCVPISRLAECIRETNADLATSSIVTAILGHVGDGNFHIQMLIDPESNAERDQAEALNARLVARTLAMDGTCTGEHGVGLHKMPYLKDEHGAEGVELMRKIKRALDPDNILNPHKVIDA